MDDLIAFLHARLDEDEQTASAATDGPWLVDSQQYAEVISASDGTTVVGGGRWGGEASVFESTEDAMHIARHDPARVLTEVDAKRGVVNAYEREAAEFRDHGPGMVSYDRLVGSVSALRTALEFLALPYADHPNYDTSWRP